MESSPHSPGTSVEMPPSADPTADSAVIHELEAVLEHHFARPELLRHALTHSSLAHERDSTEPGWEDSESLEFLGHAVVGMVAAEYVSRRYPALSEGALTRLRGALV